MATVDWNERQLILKLVYYGPALSGKTTNLSYIYDQVHESNRGRLLSLDTRDDRTLFFDLLPIFFQKSGLSFRVKIYTVPGQPMHEATRRVVLKGADGVAFVADSRRGEGQANLDSYQGLLANLQHVDLPISRVPIIVQYNKQDLDDCVPVEEMRPFAANPSQTVVRASALRGDGVLETFYALLAEVWRRLDDELQIESRFGIRGADFADGIRDHMHSPARSAH